MLNKKPEVLSPARSVSSIEAAVRSGADAVYLGATKFSARRNAENFTLEELRQTVSYCHIRGVKVYITLNTMIKQSELNEALQVAKDAYKAGVDGVIISDLGLASLIRKSMPDFPLHASTQMTMHSYMGLKYLKNLGFSRVVAAREMSKEELKLFLKEANELGIEVEVFVHGALCMSVSGQCLLSSVLGARSGNRGLCAGPCRLPFKAKGGTGYDLSLKDLSLLEHIKELCDMGVSSLKIEGRMKRPEYISAATMACRQAVDDFAVDKNLSDLLVNIFSRSGFTDGYYSSKLGRDMFGIRTKEDVANSKDAFSKIHEFYRKELQRIGVDITFTAKNGERCIMEVSDGKNKVSVFGDIPETAQNKETDKDFILQSLGKLGGTPYFARNIEINLENGLFMRSSQLNNLRREALERLSEIRGTVVERKVLDIKPDTATSHIPTTQKLIARFKNFEEIPKNLDGIDGLIIPTEAPTPKKLPENVTLIAEMPRWIKGEEKLLQRLLYLKEKGFTYALCGSLPALYIAQKSGLKVMGGIGLNILNGETARVLKELNTQKILLSAETKAEDIITINSPIKKGVFAYGRLPLMLLKNCPIKNGRNCKDCDKKGFLTDRLGTKFPVICRDGVAELFNSTPVFLADNLEAFSACDFLMLYFTDETSEKAEEIIQKYRFGGKIKDYTRGLYFKTLI